MKQTYIYSLLLVTLTCFYSCDISKKLLINGEGKHTIYTECGTIEVYGLWFENTYIRLFFNGEHKILLDSIKIIGSTFQEDYKEHISYSIITEAYKLINIPNDTVLSVSNGIGLEISQKNSPIKDLTSHLFNLEDKCLLLQNAIYCNGKALPIDTIKFEGLFSREKRKK